jgi:hypothetical protein
MKFYILIREGAQDSRPWIRGPYNSLAQAKAHVDNVEYRPFNREFLIFSVDEYSHVSHELIGKFVPPSLALVFRWIG